MALGPSGGVGGQIGALSHRCAERRASGVSEEASPRPGPDAGEASVPSCSSRGGLMRGLHEEHPECHLLSQVRGGLQKTNPNSK